MSIEKITSKIISDAQVAAQKTLDEANARCDEILAEAEKKAAAIVKSAEEKALDEKQKLIARRKSVVEIDGRKLILDAKQKMIASCFEQAIDKLTSMEKENYIAFLAGLVEKTGEKEGQLILNEKDRAEIGGELIARIAQNLPDSQITLAEETGNIRGGFLLKKGSVYINGTIEALVGEAREELIGEVANRLFQ